MKIASHILIKKDMGGFSMASEEKTRPSMPHSLHLDERQRLTVTGVQEVVEFNEDSVTVQTVKGLLSVRGSGLRVDKLEKEAGELRLTGTVSDLGYEDAGPGQDFFSRLFR